MAGRGTIEILAQSALRSQNKWTSTKKLVHLLLRRTCYLCCSIDSPRGGAPPEVYPPQAAPAGQRLAKGDRGGEASIE
jgi:hypothetical protein